MGRQLDAVRASVEALKLDQPQYAALVAHVESLAEQLDEKPGNSVLLRAFSPALRLLLSLGDLDDMDEGHRQLLELVRVPSPRSRSQSTG